MMITNLGILVLVGVACASISPAWRENTEYIYLVNGRTLTSLYELSNHYAGVFLKAKLYITPRSDGKLQARVTGAQYAQIHTQLPDNWNTKIPESELNYNSIGISEKPFHIVIEDDLIKGLIVEKELTNWEVNIIKSIVSQFQLDIQGKKVIYSTHNTLPTKENLEGVFKTMEETITGEVETSYAIHCLPDYLIQSQPWLVPKPDLKGEDQVVEVIKNKNYTNSKDRPIYHYGFGEIFKGNPTSNKMGDFFLRQSNSRVILTGRLSRYMIQHAQTTNKIIVNPTLNAKEQGSVVSTLNVTLYEIKTQEKQSQELIDPVEVGNLVYTFSTPFATSNKVHQKQKGQTFKDFSYENIEEVQQRFYRSISNDMHKTQTSYYSIPMTMQYQSRPTINQAPEIPLLPYYMGYMGRSIKTDTSFDLRKHVENIAKEISQDLPNPEQILVQSTLSKYAILCSLVRLMSAEEINFVVQKLYTESKKGPEYLTWVAFRDAVAQAGTGPALVNVQRWIESHRIEKEEASEVVASIAYAIRVPTEEIVLRFFDLIRNPIVRNQEYLNETALFSFTRLVNRVYVNKNESHNQYPTYIFGSFYTEEGEEFVKSILLPYLTKHLHEAVFKADSRKIHVYIRALGNLGHKKILEAFEPYLEGEKKASQFQRMLMVLSMDKLVISEPVIARSVLYRIYSNTAEVPEVRVVAIFQLMRTVPPTEMIHHMAESTNTEPQEQVNAAVKSVIEYASKLSSPGSKKLRESAESAKHLLTKKTYGTQESLNILQDFFVKNMNIEFKHNLVQVGSKDHTLPKGVKYTVRGNINGMKHYFFNTQAMVSSLKELTNTLYKQTEDYYQKSKHQSGNNKWSSVKIAEFLNLQTNEREQLEGFIYSEMESFERIWSFDNQTIAQLPQVVFDKEKILQNGKDCRYVKLQQLKEMALSIPTEMGLPFLYTIDMPLFIHFEGKIKANSNPQISKNNKLHMPQHLFGNIDALVTVSTKVQSHLSIVTPFDQQIYISGFDKNIQLHLPIIGKVNIDLDDENPHAKLQFEVREDHKDAKLLHYSSWPYTSRSNIMDLQPVALRKNTHRIRSAANVHRSFDFIVGKKEAGMCFRVWGHHPHQSVNIAQLASLIKSEGIASIWHQVWDKSSLQQTEANIAFIPNQSSTRKVILNLRYQKQYQNQSEKRSQRGIWEYIFGSKKIQNQEPKQLDKQKQERFWTMDELSPKVQHDAQERQKIIMSYIGTGIHNAYLHYFDASAIFQGDKEYNHTFTIAAAKSNVAPEFSFVSFYENNAKRPIQFAFQIKGYIPNTNEFDLNYAINTAPKSKYEALLQYGHNNQQSSKVRVTVDLNRSSARRKYLEETSLYQVCKKQMEEGNLYLSACQHMTIESNFIDDIKIKLRYDNFREGCTKYIDNLFKGIRFWYYPTTDIRTIQSENQNEIDLRFKFEPESLRQVNVTIGGHNEETKIFNVPISEVAVSHPVLHLTTIVLGHFIVQENIKSTCVLDNKSAQTFSNWTYPLAIGHRWTLIMMYTPQTAFSSGQTRQQSNEQLMKQPINFAAFVRETSPEHREIKITFNHPEGNGKTVEINMKSKNVSVPYVAVSVDGKDVQFSNNEAANLFNGYVEIYALPKGEVKLEIRGWFYIIFDGYRITLTATSEKLRDSIIGLCGRFSKDMYEDFWTPNNCIVKSTAKFIESFIVEGTKQQPEQNQQYQGCVPMVLPLYANVISDHDVGRRIDNEESSSSGILLRRQYIEENGDICFTIYPVPVCENITLSFVTKDVPVHCFTQSNTTDYIKQQIEKWDSSQETPTKNVQVNIPQQCA